MLVSVFTPTYNRAKLLISLFKSLKAQISKEFEWIVINDGSSDDTDDVIRKIISTNPGFTITYVKKENGGKHRAINDGLKIAKGELFFIVDSDDTLTPDAILKISTWFSLLDSSHKYAGIAGLRGYSEKKHIGEKNYKVFVDARNIDRKRFHLRGDKAEVYFTDILRKYPFPEFKNEKFISEEVVWDKIAKDNYFIRWYSEIIYICDYRNDGLTKNIFNLNKENPQGLCYWAKNKILTYPNDIKEQMLATKCYHSAVKSSISNRLIANNLGVSIFFLYATLFAAKISSILHKKST